MTMIMRPRVAAIGLSDAQIASIEPLCGELRQAGSLSHYLQSYSWTETDVMVASTLDRDEVYSGVNLMTIGPNFFYWSDSYNFGGRRPRHSASTQAENTERELAVPPACPDLYKPLATELSRQPEPSDGTTCGDDHLAGKWGRTDQDDIGQSCGFETRSSH